MVVTIHDIIHLLYPEFLPSNFAFLYAQRMIRRSLTRGDRIIAVSQNTRADLMQHFDVDGRQDRGDLQRRRGRLPPAALPHEDLQRWLRDLGIAQPYLLFVGNPAKPHKNLDTVVQAYARARRMAQFDAPLVCVGSREGSEFKIRQRAEYLGIGDKVRLLGHVAQEALPAIYQGATLFLYPTLYEGFGLPVVEAMASGVAVITSNTSALQGDRGGLRAAGRPARPRRHGQGDRPPDGEPGAPRPLSPSAGQRRAEDFRWDQAARKTLDVYLAVDRGPPSRAPHPSPWRRA